MERLHLVYYQQPPIPLHLVNHSFCIKNTAHTMDKKSLNKADSLTRRNFISQVAKTTLGVTVGTSVPLHAAQKAPAGIGTAKRVIYLWMSGGMSHLDTLSPKEANDSVTSNFDIINTSADGVRFASTLPNLASQAHHMAVIETMNSTQGAHGRHHPTPWPWLMGSQLSRSRQPLPPCQCRHRR